MRLAVLVSILITAAGCGGRDHALASDGAVRRSTVTSAPAIRGAAGQVALETAAGRATVLAAHGKEITVVALWATYCQPCLDELPYVDALFRAHPRDDVAVLAINIDDRSDPLVRARVAAIEHELGLELPRLYGGGQLMERLAPRDAAGQPQFLLPMLAVIDRRFQVHLRLGFDAGTSVAGYLAEKEALIASARRGDAPVRLALPTDRGGAGNRIKLKLPMMSGAELAAFVVQFRSQMAEVFPHLDAAALDALAARAAEAARIGGVLEVDLSEVLQVPPSRAR